jgi:shikimate dehydrogenase
MKDIQKLRQRIDEIDDQLLDLINQRLQVAREIGKIKNLSGTALIDTKRESQIFQRLSCLNNGPIREDALHKVFRAVIAAGRGIQSHGEVVGTEPLYAVIGNPIGHSLSPVMHNSALAHCGLNGCYLAFQVENIEAAVNGIRGLGIRGVSVTIPHKIAVMQHLDEVDPMAAEIGAVNTILNKDGVLHGYNSDCSGAVMAIAEKTVIKDKEAAIIGAGGAARAIGFGLKQEGAMVTIINRTKARGEKLAKDLGCRFISLEEVKELPYHLVVNATPAGMTPDFDSMPITTQFLKPEMVIMDMVYNPLQTRFLKEAEIIGCTIVDGVSMFVHQGAVQFELWTSHKAPVKIMRKVVLEKLQSHD